MKSFVLLIAVAFLTACTAIQPSAPVDAGPVMQGGSQLASSQGAKVTGRDWNNQPSESRGTAGTGDGKE